MATALPTPGDCCNPCQDCGDLEAQQVPGPQGMAGAACDPCVDGINAFTFLNEDPNTGTEAFTMPAVNTTAYGYAQEGSWVGVDQVLFIETAGYMQAVEVVGDRLTLKNLGYTGNAAPATPIPTGVKVSPGGLEGPQGSSGSVDVLTTKGDLLTRDLDSYERLPVGADGTTLHSNSADPLGVTWSKVNLALGPGTEVTGALPIVHGGHGQTSKAPGFDALAPTTTQGDIIYFGLTSNIRLAIGAANTVLATVAGVVPVWSKVTAAMLAPGVGGGGVIQMESSSRNDAVGFTSLIPIDDTIPQNTEGTEVLTVTITPTDAATTLAIEALINVANISGINLDTIVCALFRDATVDAIAVSTCAVDCRTFDDQLVQVRLYHEVVAGSTAATTFKLQMAGADSGGSGTPVILNGTSGPARVFGGVARSWLRVVEFAA